MDIQRVENINGKLFVCVRGCALLHSKHMMTLHLGDQDIIAIYGSKAFQAATRALVMLWHRQQQQQQQRPAGSSSSSIASVQCCILYNIVLIDTITTVLTAAAMLNKHVPITWSLWCNLVLRTVCSNSRGTSARRLLPAGGTSSCIWVNYGSTRH